MYLAIPDHHGRIAPVFDTCHRILVLKQGPETFDHLLQENWHAFGRHARIARLDHLQVKVLLCGGISCWMEEQIKQKQIRLIPWLAGEIPEILRAFQEGRISDPTYAMPGRRSQRRRSGQCGAQFRQRGDFCTFGPRIGYSRNDDEK